MISLKLFMWSPFLFQMYTLQCRSEAILYTITLPVCFSFLLNTITLSQQYSNQTTLMRYLTKVSFFLAASLCFYSCFFKSSQSPSFQDADQTLKKLKNTYQCESIEIELENWEEDDVAESTLTVCLINSKAVPSGDADASYQELVKIASQIKESLKKPKKYKSYYIIFVTRRKTSPGSTFDAHTLGAMIAASEL